MWEIGPICRRLAFEHSRKGLVSHVLLQVKELCSLGFTDEVRCQEVLRQSEGEVRGALSLLQRPLMEPFHQRMWSDQPEPPIDINHPDKQVGHWGTLNSTMCFILAIHLAEHRIAILMMMCSQLPPLERSTDHTFSSIT